MAEPKTQCKMCGAKILLRTAEANDGNCLPCSKGRSVDDEDSSCLITIAVFAVVGAIYFFRPEWFGWFDDLKSRLKLLFNLAGFLVTGYVCYCSVRERNLIATCIWGILVVLFLVGMLAGLFA